MNTRRLLGPVFIFGLFIGFWYLGAYNIHNNFSPVSGKALILPPPHRMFEGVNHIVRADILTATRITLVTSTVGLAIAVLIGWTLAVVMAYSKWLETSLWPFLVALQAVPIVAMVPLLIQLIGVNSRARLAVVVLISLFPVVTGALDGLNRVSQAQINLFRLYGASRVRMMRRLRIPNAVPSAMTGVRVAAGLSVVGAIVGDFFFARGNLGLGRLITEYFQNTQPGPMLLASMLAAILGLLLFAIVSMIARQLIRRWSPQTASVNQ